MKVDENKWVIEKVNAFSSMKEDQIKNKASPGIVDDESAISCPFVTWKI